MEKNNSTILKGLHVVSWIIFIGLCIEAGALLFNFGFTLYRPIASHNVYNGLNLSNLYQNELGHFIGIMSCIVLVAVLKAYLFYLVVRLFSKLNIEAPFSIAIAKIIEKISYEAFSIAIISVVAKLYAEALIANGLELHETTTYWNDTDAFLMMAAIVYVIAQIFKRGIELQQENDLTV
ncbi:MAG: hypothetical protein RLZZ236_84 [Bacteroidota bacterium]|jgi:hypothetical protein